MLTYTVDCEIHRRILKTNQAADDQVQLEATKEKTHSKRTTQKCLLSIKAKYLFLGFFGLLYDGSLVVCFYLESLTVKKEGPFIGHYRSSLLDNKVTMLNNVAKIFSPLGQENEIVLFA